MADRNNAAQNANAHDTFKEAVCIDVARIYDSCSDKDCLEDLRVHFDSADQAEVNNAFSVKTHDALMFQSNCLTAHATEQQHHLALLKV
jgi:hypothetical protein